MPKQPKRKNLHRPDTRKSDEMTGPTNPNLGTGKTTSQGSSSDTGAITPSPSPGPPDLTAQVDSKMFDLMRKMMDDHSAQMKALLEKQPDVSDKSVASDKLRMDIKKFNGRDISKWLDSYEDYMRHVCGVKDTDRWLKHLEAFVEDTEISKVQLLTQGSWEETSEMLMAEYRHLDRKQYMDPSDILREVNLYTIREGDWNDACEHLNRHRKAVSDYLASTAKSDSQVSWRNAGRHHVKDLYMSFSPASKQAIEDRWNEDESSICTKNYGEFFDKIFKFCSNRRTRQLIEDPRFDHELNTRAHPYRYPTVSATPGIAPAMQTAETALAAEQVNNTMAGQKQIMPRTQKQEKGPITDPVNDPDLKQLSSLMQNLYIRRTELPHVRNMIKQLHDTYARRGKMPHTTDRVYLRSPQAVRSINVNSTSMSVGEADKIAAEAALYAAMTEQEITEAWSIIDNTGEDDDVAINAIGQGYNQGRRGGGSNYKDNINCWYCSEKGHFPKECAALENDRPFVEYDPNVTWLRIGDFVVPGTLVYRYTTISCIRRLVVHLIKSVPNCHDQLHSLADRIMKKPCPLMRNWVLTREEEDSQDECAKRSEKPHNIPWESKYAERDTPKPERESLKVFQSIIKEPILGDWSGKGVNVPRGSTAQMDENVSINAADVWTTSKKIRTDFGSIAAQERDEEKAKEEEAAKKKEPKKAGKDPVKAIQDDDLDDDAKLTRVMKTKMSLPFEKYIYLLENFGLAVNLRDDLNRHIKKIRGQEVDNELLDSMITASDTRKRTQDLMASVVQVEDPVRHPPAPTGHSEHRIPLEELSSIDQSMYSKVGKMMPGMLNADAAEAINASSDRRGQETIPVMSAGNFRTTNHLVGRNNPIAYGQWSVTDQLGRHSLFQDMGATQYVEECMKLSDNAVDYLHVRHLMKGRDEDPQTTAIIRNDGKRISTSQQSPRITVRINSRKNDAVLALVDSGAEGNIISSALAAKFGIKPLPGTGCTTTGFTGDQGLVEGKAPIDIYLGNVHFTIFVHIMHELNEPSNPFILGMPFVRAAKVNFLHDHPSGNLYMAADLEGVRVATPCAGGIRWLESEMGPTIEVTPALEVQSDSDDRRDMRTTSSLPMRSVNIRDFAVPRETKVSQQ